MATMAKAKSGLDLHPLWAERFNAGDIDGLVSLYEPDAVMRPEPGQTAAGLDEIRGVLQGFLTLNATFEMQSTDMLKSGDIALLYTKWTLKGTDPEGKPLEMAGTTSDVARRQSDGSWLYVIDSPFGGNV